MFDSILNVGVKVFLAETNKDDIKVLGIGKFTSLDPNKIVHGIKMDINFFHVQV